MVFTSCPLPASIFEIVSSAVFATQIAPFANAIPSGKLPTGMSCTLLFVSASIRETVPSRLLVTHTSPPPIAMPLGLLPTATVCTTAFVSGSILETEWSSALVTQYAPSPTARRVGVAPTAMSATSSFELESTIPTEFPAAPVTDVLAPSSPNTSTETVTAVATAASAGTRTSRRRAGRRSTSVGSAGDVPHRRLHVERGVVDENRPFESVEGLARFEPELLVQHSARVLVGGEGLRLTVGAVQGEHQLAAKPLT